MSDVHRTVPGLDPSAASKAVEVLAGRLVGTIDLQLVLKHVHWNVVGREFISVHEMLDEQVEAVRIMTDEIAERIATLGGTPNGNSGSVVANRTWDDYPLGRAPVADHLAELDQVYEGVIADHRIAIDQVGDLDLVTQDLLIGHTAKLELFQWFIRSFGGVEVDLRPADVTTRAAS